MGRICFVYDCSHRADREICSFFRFPTQVAGLKRWERLCRRGDRTVNPTFDRICSCHFVDHDKANGPTKFPWNEGKLVTVPDPPVVKSPVRERGPSKASPTRPSEELAAPVILDHGYGLPSRPLTEIVRQLKEEKIALLQNVDMLVEQLDQLKLQKSKKKPMTVGDIKDDSEKFLMYTSLTYDIFVILVALLERFNLQYHQGWSVTSIPLEDQLLITLMKLRLNLRDLDLGERFCCSRTTVSNVVKTLVRALHELLFTEILNKGMPSQAKCRGSMPKSFNEFVSARIVIDATEITQDIPRELNKQASCYSSYKSRHTVKSVTGVAPNGAIVYVSDLYPGSASDVSIVDHSKLLEQLVPGDLILADKGFTIHKLLPNGVNLNIPPFLIGKSQFTQEEALLCSKIARARIHVERANAIIKNFDILRHIPSNLRSLSTAIFQLCCCLVNFQAPLLAEISDKYVC